MIRTATPFVLALAAALATSRAQEPTGKPPAGPAQPDVVQEVLGSMRAAEAACRTVRLELKTSGSYPGGPAFETKGSLRVLRGEQRAVHTVVEFRFDDGLAGRLETVRNPTGVWMLEDSPTFGEVFLHLDPALVADVEWAAALMKKGSEVPGVSDSRAEAPLGSALLADLARLYDLRELGRTPRDGQEGTWIGGDVRSGLKPDVVGDLPLADRVELFVRSLDRALLEVVYLQDGTPIQRIEVMAVELDRPMELPSFRIDAGGRKPKDVREHQPAWAPIERLLKAADAAAAERKEPPRPSLRQGGGR